MAKNPNNLTNAQVKAGYSTIKGAYNPVTGKSWSSESGGSSGSSSGSGLTKSQIAAGYSTIPGDYDPLTGKLKGGKEVLQGQDIKDVSQPVDISQPNTATETINPTNKIVPYDQALKGLQISGQSSSDIANATNELKKRYTQGFQQTVASGIPDATTQGQALSEIQQTSPMVQQEDTSIIDSFMQEDKGLQAIKDNYAEYYSPENQKASLMDTYNKLYKKAGLEQLDEEIIDAQTVIDGTEDDIRNEIEQAGGFGTDSQVQAMALSRNKVLLKNYNQLVSLRESKSNNLNTMMTLAEKDRTYADNQVDKMFEYETKMLDYRDKFIQNAKDQYNKYEPAQLYSMLKDNPRQLAFAEAIMGLGEGGLQNASEAPLSLKDQLLTEQIKTEKAQRSKIYADMNQINENGTITGKPQNATQSAANSYANRLAEANVAINNLGNKFTGKLSQLPAFNFMKSSDRQVYEQAQKNFITAVLRRESGASIAPSEFDTAADVYFPQPGDSTEVVKQKAQTRNLVINNFYREANVLRPVKPGDIIENDGVQYKVGLDGETLEEI